MSVVRATLQFAVPGEGIRRRDEAIVFVVYDSDPARVGVTPHASFENPLAPPDAPPRRSLEVRTFAFF